MFIYVFDYSSSSIYEIKDSEADELDESENIEALLSEKYDLNINDIYYLVSDCELHITPLYPVQHG